MKKICFTGQYGVKSHGDDAPLVVLVEELRRRIGNFEGVVLTRHALEAHYSRYGLRSIQNLEYDSKAESEGKWFRGLNPADERIDLCNLQDELSSSDLLVIGAGNFLVDYSIDLLRGPIPYLLVLTLMARMGGTPVMWYGISAGPIKTMLGRDFTRLAANLAGQITLRDEGSIHELINLGFDKNVIQLPDPVIGIIPVSREIAAKLPSCRKVSSISDRVVTISVRGLPDEDKLDFEDYLSGFADACDRLVDMYEAAILFVPQCTYAHGNPGENDIYISKRVMERMRHAENAVVAEEDLSPEECAGLYDGSFGSICTRLHGNVFAAIQGVPPVAVSYNPKVSGFMHWLECDELVVDLAEFSSDELVEKFNKTIMERSELEKKVKKRIEEGKGQISRYADIAMELIDARD